MYWDTAATDLVTGWDFIGSNGKHCFKTCATFCRKDFHCKKTENTIVWAGKKKGVSAEKLRRLNEVAYRLRDWNLWSRYVGICTEGFKLSRQWIEERPPVFGWGESGGDPDSYRPWQDSSLWRWHLIFSTWTIRKVFIFRFFFCSNFVRLSKNDFILIIFISCFCLLLQIFNLILIHHWTFFQMKLEWREALEKILNAIAEVISQLEARRSYLGQVWIAFSR